MIRRLTRKQARELVAMERAFMRSPAALVLTEGRRRVVAANPAYRRLACPPGTHACGCADWRHLAEHDALTGLRNRAQLESELARALGRAARHRHRMAALFVDLDGFKQVNDRQGHACGEALLARWGGDEFVVLVESPRHAADAAQLLGVADAAMHGAKRAGGDGFAFADARAPLRWLNAATRPLAEHDRQ